MLLYQKTIFSAYLARGTILCLKAFQIPLLLRSLSQEEYVIFLILSSLEGWFLLLDFGLGSSLQNAIAKARALKDSEGDLLKTALVLGGIALGLGLLLLFSTYLICSHFLFKQCSFYPYSLYLLCGLFFLLGTFGSIANKIVMGRKQGFLIHLTQAAAYTLSFTSLLSCSILGKTTLIQAILCTLGFPCLASLGISFFVFSKVSFQDSIQWELIHKAKNFFYFSVTAALVTLSDALIAPRTLQAQELIEYNFLCKIFGLFSFAYAAFLQSLSPYCSECLATGHVEKIRSYTKQFFSLGLLGAGIFTCCVWMLVPSIESKLPLSLSFTGVFFFGAYVSIRLVCDFYAMILQSVNLLRPFFYLIPCQACICLSLQWILSSYFGVAGILGALFLSYLVTVFWALPKQIKLLESPS